MRKLIALTLGALLAAAQACGPTREIVTGASESCTRSGSAGVCEGRFAKLSGTFDEVVQAPGCHTNVAVAVEVLASVESGSLRVLTIGPDAMEYTAEASPGRPASLTGAAA